MIGFSVTTLKNTIWNYMVDIELLCAAAMLAPIMVAP